MAGVRVALEIAKLPTLYQHYSYPFLQIGTYTGSDSESAHHFTLLRRSCITVNIEDVVSRTVHSGFSLPTRSSGKSVRVSSDHGPRRKMSRVNPVHGKLGTTFSAPGLRKRELRHCQLAVSSSMTVFVQVLTSPQVPNTYRTNRIIAVWSRVSDAGHLQTDCAVGL